MAGLDGLEICEQISERGRMIYVLAYPRFDAAVMQSLDAFRGKHEPARARLVAPHITLVFGVRTTSAEDIAALCAQVARQTKAIATEFASAEISYDPFEKTHKISLLCSKGADLLTALHRKLYEGPHLHEFDPEMPYRPHMTIGASVERSKLHVADTASIGTFPITANIDDLAVVRLINGELQTISTIKLSK